jgi:predicted Zn-dependent protease
VGYAPEARFQRYQRTIAGCILSFSRLTDRKALDAQPDRIRLYRVTSPMTLEDAVQAGSGSLSQLEDMALLNNLRPGARLEPGLLLKVVRSGG